AQVRIQDDDSALTVHKTPSVTRARVGETITYTYRITHSGGLTLSSISAVDDLLGPVSLDTSSLVPGASTGGQLAYTVQPEDLPGPLENSVTVTGTPLVGNAVVVTAE